MITWKYIFCVLAKNLNVFYSWGAHNFKGFEDGLMFDVQGFIFKGTVKVTYNLGSDLFDILLINPDGSIHEQICGIYVDQLQDVIDDHVEKTADYNERVKQEYGI